MRRWRRASVRALIRQPAQLALAIIGVALGVTVVVAVQLANTSAERAFELAVDRITGDASHHITAPPPGIDEAHYRTLRIDHGLRASAPVIERFARLPDGATLRVLGVDPLAGTGAATALVEVDGEGLERLLTGEDTALLAAPTAERHDIATGDRVALDIAGATREVTIIGRIEPGGQPAAAIDGLLVVDIATAQVWFDRRGRLDRIEVDLEPDEVEPLRAWLPAGLDLERVDARAERARGMTAAFRTNLTAMALLTVVIGVFLIYNTMTFAVVRRRRLIATLRGLGVTRGQIFAQITGETLAIGAIATSIGLAGGVLLAQSLVDLVTRTIDDLYFVVTVSELFVAPGILAQGIAIGLLASLLGALGPAAEAAASPPAAAGRRSVLEHRARRLAPALATIGLLLIGATVILVALPGGGLAAGFLALATLLLGGALLMPAGVLLTAPPLARLGGRAFGPLGRMAGHGTAAGLSRTGLAVVALAVALSATVSVGMMITSFRTSVEAWLDRTLAADLYVTAPQRVAEHHAAPLPADVPARVAGVAGVGDFSRSWRVEVDTPAGRVSVLALDPAADALAAFDLVAGERRAALAAFAAAEAVLVTEPYANRHDIVPGERITLRTAAGERPFVVAGVYRDYNTDRGIVTMHRDLFDRWWDDDRVSSLGIYLAPDADIERTTERLRDALAATGPTRIHPAAGIREASLAVFDRTFAITGILRWLAIGVAFVGVVTALLALELERARERAILRATGATPAQLGGLITLQNAMLGLMAGLFSLPLGYALGQLLIQVINRRGFGWTIDSVIPPMVFVEAIALAVGAALIAGLWPTARALRTAPARTLREE